MQKRDDWHTQLKYDYERLGDRMKKDYSSLRSLREIESWNSRSGRTIANNGANGLSCCRKFYSKFIMVCQARLTGNPEDKDLIRCATGLYSEKI